MCHRTRTNTHNSTITRDTKEGGYIYIYTYIYIYNDVRLLRRRLRFNRVR